MIKDYKGTPDTVAELIEILQKVPQYLPVRVLTISHSFPPEVNVVDNGFGQWVVLSP